MSDAVYPIVQYVTVLFFTDMEVAVIGGANTAVSEAIYLSNICKKFI